MEAYLVSSASSPSTEEVVCCWRRASAARSLLLAPCVCCPDLSALFDFMLPAAEALLDPFRHCYRLQKRCSLYFSHHCYRRHCCRKRCSLDLPRSSGLLHLLAVPSATRCLHPSSSHGLDSPRIPRVFVQQ